MTDEDAFLRKLLEGPADDTARLVYADWLEERGDDLSAKKAELVRLVCRLRELPAGSIRRVPIETRIRRLTPGLDPDWLGRIGGPETIRPAQQVSSRPGLRRPSDPHIVVRCVLEEQRDGRGFEPPPPPIVEPDPDPRVRINRERDRRKARKAKRQL
jgi:uncharacterized protein (TIGR02996 family)